MLLFFVFVFYQFHFLDHVGGCLSFLALLKTMRILTWSMKGIDFFFLEKYIALDSHL